MLREDLDKQVQVYLLELGKVGGVVNKEIAIASARGIVCKKDSRMHIVRKWWACVNDGENPLFYDIELGSYWAEICPYVIMDDGQARIQKSLHSRD